jgi:hypothetical protein
VCPIESSYIINGTHIRAPPRTGIKDAKPYIIPNSRPLKPIKDIATPNKIPSNIAVIIIE